MSWLQLQLLTVVYIAGTLAIYRKRWYLFAYIWAAFGFAFVFIHLSLLQEWNMALAALEASHTEMIMAPLGLTLTFLDDVTLLVPDPTGWSSLRFSIECSTLIELSVFSGLVLFYPRFTLRRRWSYLALGVIGTYLLNLLRVVVIVVLIHIWGKPMVPVAHAVIGRLVYFAGVIALYWFILTKPTLAMVRRSIEVSGRAVQ